jgi:hypothetical protein
MLKGSFQRAAMAILLMGTLLAPFGTCQQWMHKPAHSCCVPASAPGNTARTNCCKTSDPLPAAIVAPSLPRTASFTVAQQFAPSNEFSLPSEFPTLAVIPPHSPPSGAFILRI